MVQWKALQQQYQKRFPDKIITNLRSRYVNTDIYHPRPMEPILYDIFFYGTDDVPTKVPLNDIDFQYFNEEWMKRNGADAMPVEYNFYPFRKRLRNLFITNSHRYRTLIFEPHGSYPDFPKGGQYITGDELSKTIAQSYLTICTRSRSDTLMKKYLEISASGSTILGNIPSDYKNLFSGNIVEVDESMTDEEILSVVDKALTNKTELTKRARAFAHHICTTHNYSHAYKDFLDICTHIYSTLGRI
jgi:hypothetical protein